MRLGQTLLREVARTALALVDVIIIGEQHHAQRRAVAALQRLLQLRQTRVLQLDHLAMLLLQDVEDVRRLLLLRDEHHRAANAHQSQDR